MLFGELPIPAVTIVVDRELAQLPKLALSSDGKRQSVIPFNSLVSARKELTAFPVRKSELQVRYVVDPQHIYPSVDDPLEFLFYGLVASLILDGKEKAGVQLTWGGVHSRLWILLPQADMYEPVRLRRNGIDLDQRQLRFHTNFKHGFRRNYRTSWQFPAEKGLRTHVIVAVLQG